MMTKVQIKKKKKEPGGKRKIWKMGGEEKI